MDVAPYAKAIAAFLLSAVALAAQVGYTVDWATPDFVQAIATFIAPFAVFFVRNKTNNV